ncbi:L-serine ammonia-lyase [Humibacter ginsenosidimutans]|uniref:L-serine dehydratase n=1 Tax=Humibacter ginsenosidimutans TaxID=2599293 RepID=A0A5B8M4Q6_9MICO|nr:L-serine ammonia-lyase [Humibacter ginsenosidimutans]QDZ15306.1 L-serine ammonia-lyase [Humibacter ginsenosidimutans]
MAVYVSALELFSIGIGPSSSHTVGPMRAAERFATALGDAGILPDVTHVSCVLYGSLAATGVGHGTPDAVVAGLAGQHPETCDPQLVHGAWARAAEHGSLTLAGGPTVRFEASDITFEPRTRLPEHPNALVLRAWTGAAEEAGSTTPNEDALGEPAFEQTWLSVGGGFVRMLGEPASAATPAIDSDWAFDNAVGLLALCAENDVGVCDVAWRSELAARSEQDVLDGLDAIWRSMHACIERGLRPGTRELPGGLHVPRRAGAMRERLEACGPDQPDLPGEWMRAFALAVNEENAAGGRVVTAPTNGAAGILPAVLEYHLRFNTKAKQEDTRTFLLTAAAMGSILKANASISGAEGGCQAEVGSACAMAAAGLCAVLGGTPAQVENAAEIAVEHHLGLTCDPVGGLVQIPCIERNAIAASTAVSAARLALGGDGHHIVPLDVAIETMRQTGADMSDRYKETSAAGLAVNVIEC